MSPDMNNLLLRLLNVRDEQEREQCFDELLTVHVAPIVKQVLRLRLGLYVNARGVNESNPDAQDVYQDAMTRIIEVLHSDPRSLATIENFERYVGRVVSNVCVAYVRDIREQEIESWDDHVAADFELKFPRSTRPADADVETNEVLERLWSIVKRLPPKQRDAFALRFHDDAGRDLFTVLLAARIADWKDLAEGLGRSVTDLARLWTQMPMDSATAARELRTSRENVYKWKLRAIQTLKAELE